jgi:N-acetylglucosamine kinase-like BadF-type ATPase
MASLESENFRKNSGHSLFVGVDGGGTKTEVVLVDEDGVIRGTAVGGASNPLRTGVETAVRNIIETIDRACDVAGLSRSDVVSIYCGIAGAKKADLRNVMRERIRRASGAPFVQIATDAEIALEGTAPRGPALVAIAGTGSVCIGRSASGQLASAGGWGPVAGDESGGAGISRKALRRIARASDGRGEQTSLADAATKFFKAEKVEDLPMAIHAPSTDNARIAGFAKEVIAEAVSGDSVAKSIIEEAGSEMGEAAVAVIRRLGMEEESFPIGKVGSVFSAGEMFTVPMMRLVTAVARNAFLTDPNESPAVAASRLAREFAEETSA